MNAPTRIGVVGAGLMGERHARVLRSLPEVELIGVSDVDRVRGQVVADRYRVPFIDSYLALLDQVDAVVVATPTPLHFDQARAGLLAGKHVFVEKAITQFVEQGEELVQLGQGQGRLLQVGHIERFNPVYIELKKLLQEFRPVAVAFRRLSSFAASNLAVDVVLDLMIHDIDLAFDMCPGIYANDLRSLGRVVRSREIDHAVAHLGFMDGPMCTFVASRVTEHKVRQIDVTTNEAYIEADLLRKEIRIHRNVSSQYQVSGDTVKYQQRSVVEQLQVPSAEPLALQMADFVQSVREGRPATVSGVDGVRALRVVRDIIFQANNQGRIRPSAPPSAHTPRPLMSGPEEKNGRTYRW